MCMKSSVEILIETVQQEYEVYKKKACSRGAEYVFDNADIYKNFVYIKEYVEDDMIDDETASKLLNLTKQPMFAIHQWYRNHSNGDLCIANWDDMELIIEYAIDYYKSGEEFNE